ncbi:UNVERIFIED_CONTAM: hypothetical protein HDU68_005893 [Siphonaria sp. JEL0065]|nr:hypothetical protein HDU68_005893 [Siphonaria sp. JEL0065]
MTLKIFCVVSNDKNLTGFPVDFDVSLTVGDLKKAIRAEKTPELDYLAADKLTLVRICTGEVGGLTKKHLKQSKEALSLTSYGNEPEEPEDPDITDNVSMFRSAPGACLMTEGFTFKVMNSMEQVSVFTELLPAKLYHVLVLVPPQVDKAPPVQEKADFGKMLSAIKKDLERLTIHPPTLSEGQLGKNTLASLKDLGMFCKHEHDPAMEPMLTQQEFQELSLFRDEKLFDVEMTHIFQVALGPNVNIVNSEELRWLDQGGEDRTTAFKPDFHVCLKGLYCKKDEPKDRAKDARRIAFEKHGTPYRFGVPPKNLWDMITILESKLQFSEGADFGQVVRYLQHLNENAFAVLFDKTRCWLIRTREKHVVHSVEEVDWLAGGSKKKFVDFVLASMRPWSDVILAACEHFQVNLVDSNAFLGAGATGRVFKVKRIVEGKETFCALKIVLNTNELNISTLSAECSSLKAASATGVVVSVVGDFRVFEGGIGAGLLMSPVGDSIARENLSSDLLNRIAKAMFDLHVKGVQHGDPRIQNLIQDKRLQILWIDFMRSLVGVEYRWKLDALALSRSILNLYPNDELPAAIGALIRDYELNQNEAAYLALAAGWWNEVKK